MRDIESIKFNLIQTASPNKKEVDLQLASDIANISMIYERNFGRIQDLKRLLKTDHLACKYHLQELELVHSALKIVENKLNYVNKIYKRNLGIRNIGEKYK